MLFQQGGLSKKLSTKRLGFAKEAAPRTNRQIKSNREKPYQRSDDILETVKGTVLDRKELYVGWRITCGWARSRR